MCWLYRSCRRRELGEWNMEDKEYASACTNQSMGSEWWDETNAESEEYSGYYYIPPYTNPCTLDSFNGSTRVEYPVGAALEVSMIPVYMCIACMPVIKIW